jgi:hypothetical protein
MGLFQGLAAGIELRRRGEVDEGDEMNTEAVNAMAETLSKHGNCFIRFGLDMPYSGTFHTLAHKTIQVEGETVSDVLCKLLEEYSGRKEG